MGGCRGGEGEVEIFSNLLQLRLQLSPHGPPPQVSHQPVTPPRIELYLYLIEEQWIKYYPNMELMGIKQIM